MAKMVPMKNLWILSKQRNVNFFCKNENDSSITVLGVMIYRKKQLLFIATLILFALYCTYNTLSAIFLLFGSNFFIDSGTAGNFIPFQLYLLI